MLSDLFGFLNYKIDSLPPVAQGVNRPLSNRVARERIGFAAFDVFAENGVFARAKVYADDFESSNAVFSRELFAETFAEK